MGALGSHNSKGLCGLFLPFTFLFTIKTQPCGFSPQANYTERPPLVGEVSANFFVYRGCRVVSDTDSHGCNLGFLDPELLLFHSSSSSIWVDPVPDPLFLRKSGSAGNRTRDLWISSQELWPLYHRGGHIFEGMSYWSRHPYRRKAVCVQWRLPYGVPRLHALMSTFTKPVIGKSINNIDTGGDAPSKML
jgi:hypothetical protein